MRYNERGIIGRRVILPIAGVVILLGVLSLVALAIAPSSDYQQGAAEETAECGWVCYSLVSPTPTDCSGFPTPHPSEQFADLIDCIVVTPQPTCCVNCTTPSPFDARPPLRYNGAVPNVIVGLLSGFVLATVLMLTYAVGLLHLLVSFILFGIVPLGLILITAFIWRRQFGAWLIAGVGLGLLTFACLAVATLGPD